MEFRFPLKGWQKNPRVSYFGLLNPFDALKQKKSEHNLLEESTF